MFRLMSLQRMRSLWNCVNNARQANSTYRYKERKSYVETIYRIDMVALIVAQR